MQPEDSLAKKHLKDVVRVMMQPDLNEPYLEPKKPPRNGQSSEAGQYRERNWDTLWLESFPVKHHSTSVNNSQRNSTRRRSDDTQGQEPNNGGDVPVSRHRIVGKEALDILRRSHGGVGDILVHSAGKSGQPAERPKSRLSTAEAISNEHRNRGSTMRGCLDETQNAKMAMVKPQMKLPTKEAVENYQRSQSTVFKDDPYQVAALTKPEQTGTKRCGKALWNEGVCAMVIAGKIPGDPTPPARVKGEGMDIYLRALGSRTLLHHGPNQPTATPVQQKVTRQGESRETMSYSKPPSNGRREARRYSRKHPSTVLDCMRRYL